MLASPIGQSNPAVQALWFHFCGARCACHRDQLITMYYPVVRRVAGKIWKRTPGQVELDELVSYGAIGLIRAVDRYDPTRGVSFETVAAAHIRGVIFDELRVIDWAPRSVRRKQRELDQTIEYLSRELRRTPSPRELAEEMGCTEPEVLVTLRETEMAFIKPLDESPLSGDGDDDDIEGYRTPVDPIEPSEVIEQDVIWATAHGVFQTLPPRSKLVLALYYFEGLSLAQAAKVIGVREGKASALHSEAVIALREQLVEVVGSAA